MMGTIPKTRSAKGVSSSSPSQTTCPSMKSDSEDSVISAYRGRRSSGNVRIKGGASEVSKHQSLRTKAFQNELVEANRIIEELTRENRNLRIIKNRQDVAFCKFQSENEDLLRVWQTKYQTLQKINKHLEQKLKAKESIILSLNDEIDYYRKLNKDRNLEERGRLAKKAEKMELKLKERDDAMQQLEQKLLMEQKSIKQQLREQQKNAKEVEMQLGEALDHLEEYEKLDDFSDNPVGKPSKAPKPKPKKEFEKKERNKSNLDYSKAGIHYSKSVGSSTCKQNLGSYGVIGNAKKLGSTRANNNAPSSNAGYMQQKQFTQQQQLKLPQQRASKKQYKPMQRKAKELQPGEKNLTGTLGSDSSKFKGDDLDYTDIRFGTKSDKKRGKEDNKRISYISGIEDLYGDEDDLDANQFDNYWQKHLITTRQVSKDDALCNVYTKFCKNSEIGDTIIKPICGRGTTGRKL